MIVGRKKAQKITANTDCFLWKRKNDSEAIVWRVKTRATENSSQALKLSPNHGIDIIFLYVFQNFYRLIAAVSFKNLPF